MGRICRGRRRATRCVSEVSRKRLSEVSRRLDAKLVHVEDAVVEAAAEDEVVRPGGGQGRRRQRRLRPGGGSTPRALPLLHSAGRRLPLSSPPLVLPPAPLPPTGRSSSPSSSPPLSTLPSPPLPSSAGLGRPRLFFECVPNPKSDASFFWQRNSSGVASSHGWTALCRRKCFACGFFRQKRSVSNSLTTADDFWPRASSAVRGFSTSLGSRCARKRRPRADFARLLSRLMRERWCGGGSAALQWVLVLVA